MRKKELSATENIKMSSATSSFSTRVSTTWPITKRNTNRKSKMITT